MITFNTQKLIHSTTKYRFYYDPGGYEIFRYDRDRVLCSSAGFQSIKQWAKVPGLSRNGYEIEDGYVAAYKKIQKCLKNIEKKK